MLRLRKLRCAATRFMLILLQGIVPAATWAQGYDRTIVLQEGQVLANVPYPGRSPDPQPSLALTGFATLSINGDRRIVFDMTAPSGTNTVLAYDTDTGTAEIVAKDGEDVEHALLREVHEESNLDVEVERLVAVIDHSALEGKTHFRSYMFLLRETGGTLKVNDPDEQISGWDERDVAGLERAARALRDLDGTWRRWGRFRAVALEVLAGAIR